MRKYGMCGQNKVMFNLELVSKESNDLAAILHVYARSLILMKKKKYFSKREGKYFYTFNHFYCKKSSKIKIAQIYYYDYQSAEINMQSPQSVSTSRRLT